MDYRTAFSEPLWLTATEWAGHIPFALAIVEMTRPRVFVELGTQGGVSYCSFCQAIDKLQLNSRAYAVDTWKGDAQTKNYGEEVYQNLSKHHDPLYGRFSRLVRGTFDQALEHFDDETVDLLHIDGYHTLEAVTHDFETWLPKMSDKGVILFHDTNVREKDFGVWKFWECVEDRYPSFEFFHQHGLGVLAVGNNCPSPVLELCQSTEEEAGLIREFYANLGQRIGTRLQLEMLQQKWQFEKASAEAYQREFENATVSIELMRQQIEYYKNPPPTGVKRRVLQALALVGLAKPLPKHNAA